jgi:hypothetical protein
VTRARPHADRECVREQHDAEQGGDESTERGQISHAVQIHDARGNDIRGDVGGEFVADQPGVCPQRSR